MPSLKVPRYVEQVQDALRMQDGHTLADLLSFRDDHCKHLLNSITTPVSAVENTILRLLKQQDRWGAIAAAHFVVIDSLSITTEHAEPDVCVAFEAQKRLVSQYNELIRTDNSPWTLPVLYTINRELRQIAMEADDQLERVGKKPEKQAEMIRLLQTAFGACCSDRSGTVTVSRKQGAMYLACLLFKTYFRLKSLALCKNVLRGIDNADLHDKIKIPLAHRVTYNYYLGVLSFLREEYDQAELYLNLALKWCHKSSIRNLELILDYLVPIKLLAGQRPNRALLRQFSQLNTIYYPLAEAVRQGDIISFDRLMLKFERPLLQRGTYLIAERCRDVCLCNLVRLVHALEASCHQIPLIKLRALVPTNIDDDVTTIEAEVECVVANLIAQERLRGYIAHAQQVLVLSKADPFRPILQFAAAEDT